MTYQEQIEDHLRDMQSRGLFQNDVVAFDLETTGLNVGEDRIVEVCISRLDKNGKFTNYSTLIDPTIPIPKESSDTHLIFDETVEGKPKFVDVAPTILGLVSNADLITYNGTTFDMLLLVAEFTRVNLVWNFINSKNIDVYTLYKNTIPYSLVKVYKSITGKVLADAHQADADVYATVHILNELSKKNVEIVEALKNDNNQVSYLDKSRMFMKAKDGFIYFGKGKNKGERAVEHKDYLAWIIKDQSFGADSKSIANMLILGSLS